MDCDRNPGSYNVNIFYPEGVKLVETFQKYHNHLSGSSPPVITVRRGEQVHSG